jgi:hypothetical protein
MPDRQVQRLPQIVLWVCIATVAMGCLSSPYPTTTQRIFYNITLCSFARSVVQLHIDEYHCTSAREEAFVRAFETVATDFYSALPAKATKLELEAPFDVREPTIFARHHIYDTGVYAGSGWLHGDAPDQSVRVAVCITSIRSASGH